MSDSVVARGTIPIDADLSAYDKAMADLPGKSRAKIKDTMQALQAEMARTRLEMKVARNDSDILRSVAETQRLSGNYDVLKAKMALIQAEAIRQAAAFNQLRKSTTDSAEALKHYKSVMDAWSQSSQRAGMETSGAFGKSAYKLQVFAQGLDDLQYVPQMGLRPILNNLVQISPALGIVAIGIGAVIDHWDKLASLLGSGHARTAAEEMQELADATSRTAEQTARLLVLQERQQVLDSQQRDKPQIKADQQAAAHDAIVNGPISNLFNAVQAMDGKYLMNSIDQNLINQQKEAQGRLKNRNDDIASGAYKGDGAGSWLTGTRTQDYEKYAKEANEKVNEAYNQKVRDTLTALELDPDKLRTFIDRAIKDKKSLGPDADKILAGLMGALPENRLTEEDKNFQNRQKTNYAIQKQQQEEADAKFALADDRAIQDEENDREIKKYFKARNSKAAREATSGEFGQRLTNKLLESMARGQPINKQRLAESLSEELGHAGFSDPTGVAKRAIAQTGESTDEAIKKRMLEARETKEQAAAFLFAQNTAKSQEEANRNKPSYGASDTLSYRQEIQESILKGGSANQLLIAETKRQADAAIEGTKAAKELAASMKELASGIAVKLKK